MTDNQFDAQLWLSRMWNADVEIGQLEMRRDEILSSMSGIGKYDAEHIPAQTGENASESKYIEYSIVCGLIDKKTEELSCENIRTLRVINNVTNTMLRGMLIAVYINHLNWTEAGKLYNYEKSQTYKEYRNKALDAVYPFVPFDEVAVLKIAE